jgi:CO/xanthine dehydrogenase Mo-binding subunit
MGDTELCPDDGITAGSRTTPGTIPPVRQACAAAKALLVKLVGDAKTLDYSQLAKSESLKQMPDGASLTPTSEWKVLGTPVQRPNRREVVTGAYQYPSDVVRPGMLYGKILRPIAYGATLKNIDLAPAKAMADVSVVRDGNFVGVVAPTSFQAKQRSRRWRKLRNGKRPRGNRVRRCLRICAIMRGAGSRKIRSKAPAKGRSKRGTTLRTFSTRRWSRARPSRSGMATSSPSGTGRRTRLA